MGAPAASDKTETGADGNLSGGATGPIQQSDIENALPVMTLSWRAHFRRHQERFGKLDKAVRARLIRVWVIGACFVLLALAVPPAMLVHFSGHEMAQTWVMAAALCFYVFLFLFLLVRRRRWCYADFLHLTYGLLLTYLSAGVVGPRTAIFIMHLSTVWAAGYLGYSLAVDRLRHGTEGAIDTLPPPSHWITIGSVVSVLWTVLMAAIVYGLKVTDADALTVVFLLSWIGWIHAGVWVLSVCFGCMDGVLIQGEPVTMLLALLFISMMVSPVINLILIASLVFTALFYWLLLMLVVAFLGYILTVYKHYLQAAAAAPSTPAMVNEDTTLQSGIQQDNLGQVKLDIPALEEAPSETTADVAT